MRQINQANSNHQKTQAADHGDDRGMIEVRRMASGMADDNKNAEARQEGKRSKLFREVDNMCVT